MDERKRSANYDNDEISPPLKRQATGLNGTGKSRDVDMDRDPELEEFQKEAALRQMHEYKRQKQTIEREFEELQKKALAHDDHLRLADKWMSQLVDEFKLRIGQYQDSFKHSPFPSALLTTDIPALQEYLDTRANAILNNLRETFSQNQDHNLSIAELQDEIGKLLAALKKQANDLEKSRSEQAQLEDTLDKATMRYMKAEKKIDRLKSATVQKLEKAMLATSVADAEKPANSESTDQQDTVSSKALEEAEVQLKAAMAEGQKQAEQLEALEKEKHKLQSQVWEKQAKATERTDDEFAQTELFKLLKTQLDDFAKKVNHLVASEHELRQETKKLQAERAKYREIVDAELQAATSEHQQQLSRVEADLARIRGTRDELEKERGIRESTIRADKHAAMQLKEMLAAKDERIKALESRSDSDQNTSVDVSPEIDSLPAEDLRNRYRKAVKELSIMKQELDSMSVAYTKLSGSVSSKFYKQQETEERLARATAEKAKADQKYFGAMRKADTIAQETKVLRAQNAKSSELIASFRGLEAASQQQLVNLEKQLVEAKDAFVTLETKYHTTQSQIAERTSRNEMIQKQVDELKALISSRDTEFATISSTLRKAEVTATKAEAKLAEKERYFENYKKNAVGSGGDSDITESLRTMAICNVCRIRFKDRIVVQCGHAFCSDCLNERLQNRMRKCPNCNIAFGRDDVKLLVL